MRLEINENPNNFDKMEQGESNLSQQAGDLLNLGANTSSTSAERAEASKALTKDGTLPDFQLDMGDDTNPASKSTSPLGQGAGDSSLGDQVISPSSDQQQNSQQDMGDNTNSTTQGTGQNPESAGESSASANNDFDPSDSDSVGSADTNINVPPSASSESGSAAPASAAGGGASIEGSDATPGSFDSASSVSNSGSVGSDNSVSNAPGPSDSDSVGSAGASVRVPASSFGSGSAAGVGSADSLEIPLAR